MKKIRAILRAAERQHTVLPDKKRRPLWATELWWETAPDSPLPNAPDEAHQARYLAEAMKLLWERGVPVALFFQVRDDANVRFPPRTGPANGIFSADDTPKPSFTAMRIPFVATRVGPKVVTAWVRSPADGVLRVRVGKPGNERVLTSRRVTAGQVIKKRLKLRGAHRAQRSRRRHREPWAHEFLVAATRG